MAPWTTKRTPRREAMSEAVASVGRFSTDEVLEGNPAAPGGDYTVRLKLPDGYRIPPHWHSQRENVTLTKAR
jgi:hypothetical protein